MRERVEDLGKLSVLLDQLNQDDAFDIGWNGRKKDYPDHFATLTSDEQYDIIHKLVYSLDHIKEKIEECLEIARGDEYEVSIHIPSSKSHEPDWVYT